MRDAGDAIRFESSNRRLDDGFAWAKDRALRYASRDDPVGPWYEAAIAGRNAFCIRDVSHQSDGAWLLGLGGHTRNMLRAFAASIAESRDWCCYWEITRDGGPAPVDYSSDDDFWYNLPANFDLLSCCLRQYLWSGEPDYIFDPVFTAFYDRTVVDYVRRWDRDGDGLVEHRPECGRRGIAGYDEADISVRTSSDTMAAQYAGYRAYAAIERIRGNGGLARRFERRARSLQRRFDAAWWHEAARGWWLSRSQAGKLEGVERIYPLYFDIARDRRRVHQAIDAIAWDPQAVELMSYVPMIYAEGDRPDDALEAILRLSDPGLERRNYPEVSFSVVDGVVRGLLGIRCDVRTGTLRTGARLPANVVWASAHNVPIFDGEIDLDIEGSGEARVANRSGRPLAWRHGRRAAVLGPGDVRALAPGGGAG